MRQFQRYTASGTAIVLTGASYLWCASPPPSTETSDASSPSRNDGADRGTDQIEGAPGEAGVHRDAGIVDAACHDEPATDPSCVHPAVVANCDGGWCQIPAGCSFIGSPLCEWGRGAYSEPETKVTLTHAFAIQQMETSQSDWTALGLHNPSGVDDAGLGDCIGPKCPVGNVNWFEALDFANRLSIAHVPALQACYTLSGCSGTSGYGMVCTGAAVAGPSLYECDGYRLPTEAEWEYATRAGTRTAFYSGAITPQVEGTSCSLDRNLDRIAWYCFNGGLTTHIGGQKEANAWGLFDTSGNAAEWVNEEFNGLGYGVGPLTNPGAILTTGSARAIRGIYFNAPSSTCRSANRFFATWDSRGVGLRLAKTFP